jgi:lactoylglutathione lyase
MILNHLNLTVTDVVATRRFLEKYFQMRGANEAYHKGFDVVFDDNGMVLTLMKGGKDVEIKYPPTFHIGFMQPSVERVNEINQRMKEDGYDVKPPEQHHAWTFYVESPGGFVVEVMA